MSIYDKIPQDPVMLLSFINTQLRDTYESFDAFSIAFQTDKEDILKKMKDIDYEYDPDLNQFI